MDMRLRLSEQRNKQNQLREKTAYLYMDGEKNEKGKICMREASNH